MECASVLRQRTQVYYQDLEAGSLFQRYTTTIVSKARSFSYPNMLYQHGLTRFLRTNVIMNLSSFSILVIMIITTIVILGMLTYPKPSSLNSMLGSWDVFWDDHTEFSEV